ncbi:acyl-coenzyme A thioesterase 3-like isoform X2 [Panulirus ornatus]|uniref:acyl-coenzyme A thioesterase 3-like isoform X2 n=1 Tax=Panulirus ornatus TaxID=150431 RepID=UPI003A8B1978
MAQSALLRSTTCLCRRLVRTAMYRRLGGQFMGVTGVNGQGIGGRALPYGPLIYLTNGRPLSSSSNNIVNVTVTPQHAHMDVAGHVQVEGLGAREAVTLWTTLMDEKGVEFSSHAHYQADASGSVDVWRHKSQGGRYQGVFPQGLVSTLAPAPPACQQDVKLKWIRLYKRRVEEPFTYQVRVLRGHLTEKELYSGSRPETLASVHFTRDLMGPGVTRHEVEHGNIYGTLFLPPGQGPHPLVLDMFGRQPGNLEYRASMLASKGYASMSLPYFGF